jgi:molybdopterin-containing oxidoreductase family membrane subunit
MKEKRGLRKLVTLGNLWLAFLAVLFAFGAFAIFQVFTKGLIVTNLTDLVPWGLWITIDLSSIAVSAGAFLLCAAVYLLGLKRFQPVARTATFIGLIGYSMAMLTLLLDIGRPERFWHAYVWMNPHSLLWEVTMCITLYFGVLILETLPIIGEADWFQKRFPKIAHRLESIHKLAPYLAVIGLAVSMLHQSSLGGTYAVLKARPILFRPDLSVLFMVSAMAAGPSMTVLISMIAARVTKKARTDDTLLEKVSIFIGWTLVGYLYFRFWDAFAMTYTYTPGRTEGLHFYTKGPLAFNFWIMEMLLGCVVPIVILLVPKLRRIPALRMLALAFVIAGVVAYRWDTNMVGELVLLSYLPNQMITRYTSYMPSLLESLAGMGVVVYGIGAITLGVRFLNIVNHPLGSAKVVEIKIGEALPEGETAAAD